MMRRKRKQNFPFQDGSLSLILFLGLISVLLSSGLIKGHFNVYYDGPDHSMGIIASGIAYNYLRENVGDECPWPILKITQYPLPKDRIRALATECKKIMVMEEGQPFIEEQVAGILDSGCEIIGRLTGDLPRVGELNPDSVRAALKLAPRELNAPSQNVGIALLLKSITL